MTAKSDFSPPSTGPRPLAAAARGGPCRRSAHRSNLHPTKAKRHEAQHQPPATAGPLVPDSPPRLRGSPAAGQNAQQQSPDENQQIRHLMAADMVGVVQIRVRSKSTAESLGTTQSHIAEDTRNKSFYLRPARSLGYLTEPGSPAHPQS